MVVLVTVDVVEGKPGCLVGTELRFDLGPHLFNVGQCLKMKALVIEEENISRLIVCNSLRDAEARDHAL